MLNVLNIRWLLTLHDDLAASERTDDELKAFGQKPLTEFVSEAHANKM